MNKSTFPRRSIETLFNFGIFTVLRIKRVVSNQMWIKYAINNFIRVFVVRSVCIFEDRGQKKYRWPNYTVNKCCVISGRLLMKSVSIYCHNKSIRITVIEELHGCCLRWQSKRNTQTQRERWKDRQSWNWFNEMVSSLAKVMNGIRTSEWSEINVVIMESIEITVMYHFSWAIFAYFSSCVCIFVGARDWCTYQIALAGCQ